MIQYSVGPAGVVPVPYSEILATRSDISSRGITLIVSSLAPAENYRIHVKSSLSRPLAAKATAVAARSWGVAPNFLPLPTDSRLVSVGEHPRKLADSIENHFDHLERE